MKRTAQRTSLAQRTVRLLAMALPLALFAFARPAAAAGPPISASGSYQQVSFVPSNFRTADGVTFFDFTENDRLSGTFSGTSVIEGSCMRRASGQTLCQALETFTGTVAGQGSSGDTVTFRDVVRIDSTGAVHGSFTVVSGTGGLANVRGHGTFEGTANGSYTGLLVLAP